MKTSKLNNVASQDIRIIDTTNRTYYIVAVYLLCNVAAKMRIPGVTEREYLHIVGIICLRKTTVLEIGLVPLYFSADHQASIM